MLNKAYLDSLATDPNRLEGLKNHTYNAIEELSAAFIWREDSAGQAFWSDVFSKLNVIYGQLEENTNRLVSKQLSDYAGGT